MLDWLSLFLRRPCFQLQTWLFIPFNFVIVFYRLVFDEALVSRLVLHLLDNSSLFSWAIVCSSAPQLRFSSLVIKTERYWCWTDWVFLWEIHAFSYKHSCLITSTLSLMFFYRLVFDGAVIFRIVLLLVHTSSPFFGANNTCSSAPQLRCSTLVTKTAILMLDWLSFFWEHAFSYKHGCLFPSILSLFFFRLVFDIALVSRLVLHLLDNSSHFSWAIVCSTAPQLRFSTLVTKTVRYCCWTDWVFFWEDHAFSYKHDCLIPSTFSLMFFYRLVFNGAVVVPVVLHLVDFFWGHHYV